MNTPDNCQSPENTTNNLTGTIPPSAPAALPDRVCVAGLQCFLGNGPARNLPTIRQLIREAAEQGAQIILPPELFAGPYFCKREEEDFFALAAPFSSNPLIEEMSALARELGVVLPISYFERDGVHYYNSLAVIDADGSILGNYRKSHIPDGPGYEEKYYFRPGNTGFRVWHTRFARLGIGICWDQWFPECARSLVLQGADILLYPTAIGSEPAEPDLDTSEPWRIVMRGHAVANTTPVVAANRIGNEEGQIFYGKSFICNHFGELLADLDDSPGIALATLDLALAQRNRASFGLFRDRRPDLYHRLTLP